MISTVRGRFNSYTGTVEGDESNPTAAKVDVQIDASSLVTGDEKRDGHLRSPDFLDVEQFPYITFKSSRVEQVDATHGKLVGDLTIRDVTKEVVFDVEFEGQGKDAYGKQRAGFTATGAINRLDFGIKWNPALEAGGFAVSNRVKLTLHIAAVRQD
jgi:polyisoprenoid-binding protein YceI